MVSLTPITSAVAAGRDNVTFRLPKPKPASAVKNTVGDITPHANLIILYKWPVREEVLYPGTLNTELGDNQTTTSSGRAAEQRQG